MQGITRVSLYDSLTTAGIGVLAGTLAAIAHEVIGHGSGCLVAGGSVTLLTSIYFECAGATALTDAAGPLGGLAFGLIGMAALRVSTSASWARLFFFLSALIGLGWFAGQAIYCALLDKDDWMFVARALHWPPAVWRVGAVAVGIATYTWGARLLATYEEAGAVAGALAAAAASAALAGLLWAKAPFQGAAEGALAVGLAPAVLLLLTGRRRTAASGLVVPTSRSWTWLTVAAIIYLLFLLGPSRGLGSLS